MRKKLISIVAAVLALTMLVGLCAFAAASPTTSTAGAGAGSDDNGGGIVVATANVIPRGPGYMEAGEVRATSTYAEVTDDNMIATIYKNPANDPYTDVLKEQAKSLTGKFVLGPYKLRMYKAGQAIWSGFGKFVVNLGIGNGYDGLTATIYVCNKDGQVSTQTATVQAGKIVVSMEEMGSLLIELN